MKISIASIGSVLSVVLGLWLVAAVVPASPACASPRADLLWSDDFDDFDDDGWAVVQGAWSVASGAYRGQDAADGRSLAGDPAWADFRYEGRFMFDAADHWEATLMFRVQDAAPGTDQGHYYQVANYVDLDVVRLYRVGNGATSLLEVSRSFEPDVWYDFEIETWGPFVRYYVDGGLVFSYEQATDYAAGRIGVKAFDGTAWFDDLTVSTIDQPTLGEAVKRGVAYLRTSALSWQTANACNGCHVQAQAARALCRAEFQGVDVDTTGLGALMYGLIEMPEGQLPGGCFWDSGALSLTTGTAWGVVALADYDSLTSVDRRSEFLAAADCLLDEQDLSGMVREDYDEAPINQGDIMTTAMSLYGWRRAYLATGDPAYDAAVANAAAWLRDQVSPVLAAPAGYTTQDKAMLILGLMEAGDSPVGVHVSAIRELLVSEQQPDGGWHLDASSGGSNGYATGQALHAICRAFVSGAAPARDAAVAWLLANQGPGGAWVAQYWTGLRPSHFASTMWAVLALLGDCTASLVAVDDDPATAPPAPVLHQNVPNPFNPSTTLMYDLHARGRVRLVVYDVRGRMIRPLVDEVQGAGAHAVVWDGRDDRGRAVPSGTYFGRLSVDDRSGTTRMVLAR